MKKKSHKLIYEPDYSFLLIGISSHENDYHISWLINRKLGLSLRKVRNLKIFNKKLGKNQEFSIYSFENDERSLLYNLISNRCDNGFLIEEIKNIDYLLQILGAVSEKDQEKIINTLKETEKINTSFKIDPTTLKSRQRLLFQ
ncbi:hypothetical protein ES708_05379 [subsurface metagenome]